MIICKPLKDEIKLIVILLHGSDLIHVDLRIYRMSCLRMRYKYDDYYYFIMYCVDLLFKFCNTLPGQEMSLGPTQKKS